VTKKKKMKEVIKMTKFNDVDNRTAFQRKFRDITAKVDLTQV